MRFVACGRRAILAAVELEAVFELELAAGGSPAMAERGGEAFAEYETGGGTAMGMVAGTVRYSQRLQRREDGSVRFELDALITAGDAAQIVVRATGEEDAGGRGVLVARCEVADTRYRWLSEAVVVGEAEWERDHGHSHVVVYRRK